jgi:O-antigen/teichoic acid export membrane protein
MRMLPTVMTSGLGSLRRSMSTGTFGSFSNARLASASGWVALGHVGSQALRIISSLLMTRLLAPEMFGIMSLVIVVQTTLQMLSDIGLRTTVIQSSRGDDPNLLDTAWTLQVIRGFGLWAVTLALAAGVAAAGGQGALGTGTVWSAPELPQVLAIAGISSVIAGFQSTALMTASRHLEMRRLMALELIAQAAGLVFMVVVGLMWPTIWVLVCGGLVTQAVTTVLSHVWLGGRTNRFRWDCAAVAELFRFGSWIFVSSAVYVLAMTIDRLLFASLMTPAMLGLYAIALNLSTLVEGIASRLMGQVILPALSDVARSSPDQFRASFYRLRLPFDVGLLASAGLLFACGPVVVEILYDPRYLDAGWMLSILSFSLIFARYGVVTTAYIALGSPRLMAFVHIAKLAGALVLVLTLNALWGVEAAMYGLALHGAVVLPLLWWFNRPLGLNNVRFEILVLAAWPIGWAAGSCGAALARMLFLS